VEIITEPDGTIRVLTKPQEEAASIDPLAEAREQRRAAKNQNAHGNQKAS